MREHGVIGRQYAGKVTQVISGSIGFDDWEWGVDLFADDPVVFKKLIYEMRFDEASAKFAEFGPFYTRRAVCAGPPARVPGGAVVPPLVSERPEVARPRIRDRSARIRKRRRRSHVAQAAKSRRASSSGRGSLG